MQRIQRRLKLGYGLLFGGAALLAACVCGTLFLDLYSPWPWSVGWYVLAAIPSAGIALVFLTAVEERKAAEAKTGINR